MFRCPNCRGVLRHLQSAAEPASGDIQQSSLDCTGCAAKYPIRGGIPRFVSSNNYASSFGLQWSRHARTQLDRHSGLTLSADRFYMVTGWPKQLDGQWILEAGSGAGRFTEVACKTGAEVFSFDYSEAVEANLSNNRDCPNLTVFQADLFRIPLAHRAFDKIFCFGVLQHTPDPKAAFLNLIRFLKPGGEIVVDAYRKSLTSLLSWKYLLRPVTKRLGERRLYQLVSTVVPSLVPMAATLRRFGGAAAARLVPIVEYTHLGLSSAKNLDWAILDTFDMYAPEHDHPQTLKSVRSWLSEAGLTDAVAQSGPNGIVARGIKPLRSTEPETNADREEGLECRS